MMRQLVSILLALVWTPVCLPQTTQPDRAATKEIISRTLHKDGIEAMYRMTTTPWKPLSEFKGKPTWSEGVLFELLCRPKLDADEVVLWRKFEPIWSAPHTRWAGDFAVDVQRDQTFIVITNGYLFKLFRIAGKYQPAPIDKEARFQGLMQIENPESTMWGEYLAMPRWIRPDMQSIQEIGLSLNGETLMLAADNIRLFLSMDTLMWHPTGTRDGKTISERK